MYHCRLYHCTAPWLVGHMDQLWPNRWTDQAATKHRGVSMKRSHCSRCGGFKPPEIKALATTDPNFAMYGFFCYDSIYD